MNIKQIEKALYNSIWLVNLDKNKQEELLPFVKMITEKLKQFTKYFQICELYNIFNDAFNSIIVINNISNVHKMEVMNMKLAKHKQAKLCSYHECKFLENYKNVIPSTFFDIGERLCKVQKDLNKKDSNNTYTFKQLMLVLQLIGEISILLNTTEEYFKTRKLDKTYSYINETLNICSTTLNIMLDICERTSNNIERLKVGEL